MIFTINGVQYKALKANKKGKRHVYMVDSFYPVDSFAGWYDKETDVFTDLDGNKWDVVTGLQVPELQVPEPQEPEESDEEPESIEESIDWDSYDPSPQTYYDAFTRLHGLI